MVCMGYMLSETSISNNSLHLSNLQRTLKPTFTEFFMIRILPFLHFQAPIKT